MQLGENLTKLIQPLTLILIRVSPNESIFPKGPLVLPSSYSFWKTEVIYTEPSRDPDTITLPVRLSNLTVLTDAL